MAARRKAPSPVLGAAAALIGDSAASLVRRASAHRHSFEARVADIRPDPGQPRKHLDAAALANLAATMAAQGQLQPVLLRPDPEARGKWVLVAGERRWRAAGLNGWETVLAIEHDGDPEVTALIENLQRVDLSPVEEAWALSGLIEGKGWTQSQAAEALGRSKGEISATLRILSLPESLLDEVLTSELPLPRNVLVELARIEEPTERDRLIGLARQGLLTVQAIRAAKAPAARPEPLPEAEPQPSDAGLGAGGQSRAARRLRLLAKMAKDAEKLADGAEPALSDDEAELARSLIATLQAMLPGER